MHADESPPTLPSASASASRRLSAELDGLLTQAQAGSRRALARLMSVVERGEQAARDLAAATFAAAGNAHTVGITGAPGAGKSTLNSALVSVARGSHEHARVAVLAVDPSSPFSGGAILGDRVRMADHTFDSGVYIRSMATRGHLGGLSLAVPQAARVLDALGWPWIVIETVGVGQVETEIAGAADTTVVVVNPGWGDSVQANKAGLMEIADIFVVNKADRPGVGETCQDIRQMLGLAASGDWEPPILTTVGTTGDGIEALWTEIARHRGHLVASGELAARRAARLRAELAEVMHHRVAAAVEAASSAAAAEAVHASLAAGEIDPYTAASRLLALAGLDAPQRAG